MKKLEKLAKLWAEDNSSPGKDGRDDLYEILINVQEQAYQAGFKKAQEMALQKFSYCHAVSGDSEYVYDEIKKMGEEEE